MMEASGPKHLARVLQSDAERLLKDSRYVAPDPDQGPGCGVLLIDMGTYVVLRHEGDRLILLASPPDALEYVLWISQHRPFLQLTGIQLARHDGPKRPPPPRAFTPDPVTYVRPQPVLWTKESWAAFDLRTGGMYRPLRGGGFRRIQEVEEDDDD